MTKREDMGDSPPKRASTMHSTPITGVDSSKRTRRVVYPLNDHIQKRFLACEFTEFVRKLSTVELLHNDHVQRNASEVASEILHVTLTNHKLGRGTPDHSGDDILNIFKVVSACIAVKIIIETDITFSFVRRALKYCEFTHREMVDVEATILQATNWLKGIH